MAQISMKKLDAAMKSIKKDDVVVVSIGAGDSAIDVTVKKRISFSEMVDLIDVVVSNVISESGYTPEKYGVSLAGNVMAYYTNLKDDLGIDRIATLLWDGTFDEIAGCIDPCQYNEILRAVDAKIEHALDQSVVGTERQIVKAADQIQSTADAFKLIEEELSQIGTEKFRSAVENLGSITPAQLIDVMGPRHES